MSRKVKILGIQINPEIGNKIANYQKIAGFLKQYEWFKPDLVILPELFSTGLDHKIFQETAEVIPDATTMFLSGFSEKYNTYIVGGSFVEKTHSGEYKNTSLVFDRKGSIIGKYQKINMFSHCGNAEGHYLEGGMETVVVEADFGKIGLSICYDLRFPELFRSLMCKGAEIICCPAAWPYPRLEHWLTLNKARALENLCFLASVNQCGKVTQNRTNLGHSMVVNPWGEVIASAGSKEGVLITEIDLDEVQKIREQNPFLNDINHDAYL
ncbi:MAG: carbon-nitrogen family hydrolase [Candidatus Gastranaerophilaceae bacterium]|jgi:predicted amidohydrolase